MEYVGTVFPTLIVGDGKYAEIISIILQILVFALIIAGTIKIIMVYFKILKLKNDPTKNKEEIEKNIKMINESTKKVFKIGLIVFAIIILSQIILGYFYG